MLHFVKGYRRPNSSLTLDAFEDALYDLHGIGSGRANSASSPPSSSGGELDQFLLFRAVLEAESLDAFAVRSGGGGGRGRDRGRARWRK